MSGLTSHVLDTAAGQPATGIEVTLAQRHQGEWRELASTTTDADGRTGDLWPAGRTMEPGTYRLRFAVGDYHRAQGVAGFYPWADVVFAVSDPAAHYHVPLLLSPYGYSTYRGS